MDPGFAYIRFFTYNMSAIHQPIVSSAHMTDIACLSSFEDELVVFIRFLHIFLSKTNENRTEEFVLRQILLNKVT